MRFSFPNLTRPKKAAKLTAHEISLSLSTTQQALARILGYDDWHDFEKNHTNGTPFVLDESLVETEFVERQVRLSRALSRELEVPDGDTQYALSFARLTGDRASLLSEQLNIRFGCWREQGFPTAERRRPGSLGKLNAPGRRNETVILQSFGIPTTVITHRSVMSAADFEYVSPRVQPSMFMPMRLYLPYGYWRESSGARVLFSRDYKPLWRIQDGQRPTRLDPWDWIKWESQHWFWEDANTPWGSPQTKLKLDKFLFDNSIQTLPILADALPLIVMDKTIGNFSRAVEPLRISRPSKLQAA